MKKKHILVMGTFLALLITTLQAGIFSKKYDKKNITSIIVTGNFLQSRLLAESIQHRTRQPIILLPSDENAKSVFLLAPNNQAMEIPIAKLTDFFNFAHPKNVIFLGNSKYTPQRYINKLNPNIPSYVINDDSWAQNAWHVEEILGVSGLAEAYKKKLAALRRSGVLGKPKVKREKNPEEPKAILPK